MLTPLCLGFLWACGQMDRGTAWLAGMEGNKMQPEHSEPYRAPQGLFNPEDPGS